MKLLFDQNLSYKLISQLTDFFPDSMHINEFGLEADSDGSIWDLAIANGLTIVSIDSDFFERSMLFRHPPKVILVAVGNCKTSEIARLMIEKQDEIISFHRDEFASYLILRKG